MAGSSSIAKRTRQSSVTSLSRFLGGPAELLSTEVPTLRDCLTQILHIQQENYIFHEADRRNIPLKQVFGILADKVLSAWERSNSLFQGPVVLGKKSVIQRLERAWKVFSDIAWGKVK